MTIDVRDQIIARNWKQGALIKPIADERFFLNSHIDVNADDWYLVISQTCDLVHDNFDIEPYFEVLRVQQVTGSPKIEYAAGKNSRILHQSFSCFGGDCYFFGQPSDRFFVDRALLLEHEPEIFITENEMDIIINWIVNRFARAAFPEEFVKRWKERHKKIERIIKKLLAVKDIYIKLEPFCEIPDDAAYQIEIYLVLENQDFDDVAIHKQYTDFARSLEDQFNSCHLIDVEIIEPRSMADMTLDELQYLKRWDYSYLSYRDAKRHATPSQTY